MSLTVNARDRSTGAVGLGLAVFSAATFGTSGTFADSLMHAGWSPAAVVTARITVAAVLLTIPGIRALKGDWAQVRRALPAIAAFGIIAIAGCQLFFFNAVERLDVGIALLLEYLAILLVVIWVWVRHGQRPRRLTVLGGAAAALGLVLVLNPASGGIDPVGVFWALLAACGLAFFFVFSSKSDDVLPPIVLAWAAMVVGALTLIALDLMRVVPFRAASRDVVLLHRSMSWLVPVIGLSLVAAAIAYAAGIAAARRLGAKVASFVGLTEVLFAVLIAWVLLGQAPVLTQIIGGIIVLLGITLVRTDEIRSPTSSPEQEGSAEHLDELTPGRS
jgi:drug/metabolite transporter (DMT)-like permease